MQVALMQCQVHVVVLYNLHSCWFSLCFYFVLYKNIHLCIPSKLQNKYKVANVANRRAQK